GMCAPCRFVHPCSGTARIPFSSRRQRRNESAMNTLRTGMLLAALTAILVGVGALIGGTGGALIAFVVAAAMNFFSYWNADKLVLGMASARKVDARSAPEFYRIVED